MISPTATVSRPNSLRRTLRGSAGACAVDVRGLASLRRSRSWLGVHVFERPIKVALEHAVRPEPYETPKPDAETEVIVIELPVLVEPEVFVAGPLYPLLWRYP